MANWRFCRVGWTFDGSDLFVNICSFIVFDDITNHTNLGYNCR